MRGAHKKGVQVGEVEKREGSAWRITRPSPVIVGGGAAAFESRWWLSLLSEAYSLLSFAHSCPSWRMEDLNACQHSETSELKTSHCPTHTIT